MHIFYHDPTGADKKKNHDPIGTVRQHSKH